MAETTRKAPKSRTFEVLVSFDGLDRGERFTQDEGDMGWAAQHVENGYLRDVTGEPTTEEAQNAGPVGQG
jgi:hypothetical protein